LTHLGLGAAKRPAVLDTISDLEQAINSTQTFQHCYEETGNVNGITQSISHYESVVFSIAGIGVPSAVLSMAGIGVLPAIFNKLGNSYACRFKCTEDLQDIDHAISNHQKAVESTVAHKTVPMFCCFGQMSLVRSDDVIHGFETYVQQTIPFWLYGTFKIM
jgi:hypothetical protein